ncbi:MAG: HAD family hydrolase [Coriobacteriia bacterium]|nr:HAD family hydrolase [Coriobacteriia bacterium]
MLVLDIHGYGSLSLEHLVLDLNGTIAAGGELIEGVAEGIRALEGRIHPVLITADTRGTARALADRIGVMLHVIDGEWEAGDKLALVQELGPDHVAVVGNGSNDALMMSSAAVGVCVIGPEGASRATLEAADVVVTSILDALALFAEPERLIATLRT